MREISHVNISKITSKPRASLEGFQEQKEIPPSLEMRELQQLGHDIHQAVALAQDICHSLEAHLRNLSSD